MCFGVSLTVCLLLFTRVAGATDAAIDSIFAQPGLRGTLVIANLDDSEHAVHDAARAAVRYPAASTFKILNSLIALEAGAVRGLDEVFVWDGQARAFPAWNRDQTLASAYQVSCVWCYQEIARRVGPERYRRELRAARYGELTEPFVTDSFWLDGSLRISANEQLDFLRRLIRRQLPYSAAAYATLRDLMVIERAGSAVIRAKTGWATGANPPIGWYVGYLENGRATWIFALNIDVRSEADLPLRRELVMQALRAKSLLP